MEAILQLVCCSASSIILCLQTSLKKYVPFMRNNRAQTAYHAVWYQYYSFQPDLLYNHVAFSPKILPKLYMCITQGNYTYLSLQLLLVGRYRRIFKMQWHYKKESNDKICFCEMKLPQAKRSRIFSEATPWEMVPLCVLTEIVLMIMYASA